MTTRHLFALIFASSLFTACTHSFNRSKIDSLLNAMAASHQGMGSMAIAQNGQIVYQKSVGIGNTSLAGPETRYRIGSITKMFTAVMIFQLIGENKVHLNTTLSTFFPQMPNSNRITIKMMLGHQSGLHDITTDSTYGSYYIQAQTRAEMLAKIAVDKSDFEPGSRTVYCSTNFILLGYIIEKLTGKSYSEALKERITTKLDLINTTYGEQKYDAINNAKPFIWRKEHWEWTPETDISIAGGAGGIVSTTSDMLKFIRALFTGKLVTSQQLELMKPGTSNFGLGMFRFDFSGHTCYGHSGYIDGIFAEVGYFPKENLAIAYCSNGGGYLGNDILGGVMRIYFDLPYSIPTFKITRLAAVKLTPYIGTYTSRDTPIKIIITEDDGVLSMRIPGQQAIPLQPISANKFMSKMWDATFAFGAIQHTFVVTRGDQSFSYSWER